MLRIEHYKSLSETDLDRLIQRNTDDDNSVRDKVLDIAAEVRNNGDEALRQYAKRFDQVNLDQLYLDETDLQLIASQIDRTAQRALEIAFNNIYRFHQTQRKKEPKVETMRGVTCWRESRPIERVGLYIPGGSAVLPSTFLMLGVPARIAGCKEIVVCSPPQKDGKINPYIAYCAQLLKIEKIFLAGGAQAIAAMAFGTESIPKVSKIFGPGNQYVTQAKMLVQQQAGTAIDMPAGPSEVLVVADETARPEFVAADLLAQAEHGADSQAILVSDSFRLVEEVNQVLAKQILKLNRATIAQKALEQSYAVVVSSAEEAMKFSNLYAPEHLILQTENASSLARKVINAGSVFVGHLTPESAGDYASGTNHTLPTSGHAKAYSGVSVDSFVKKITFQEIDAQGIRNIGPTVEILADLEGLDAHKKAVSYRLEYLTSKNI